MNLKNQSEKEIKIDLPESVIYILNKLNSHGHQAYIVGGCVRDSLMNIIPQDWDITSSAKPEEVKSIFSHTYDTGIQHGTVTVQIDSQPFEVTTFRVEEAYTDYRRPSAVSFTRNLKEDLNRRDFTMNALAYHPQEGLIDLFDGVEDIHKKIVRCVGNPNERFQEDALRMLRAIRFSSQLGFTIEPQTLKAIEENSHLIQKISYERIRDEINKILLSDLPMSFLDLQKTKILAYIFPEFGKCLFTSQNHPYHIYNVGLHTLKSVESIDKVLHLRWAMLLHDIGKPDSKTTDAKGIDHFYGHVDKSVDMARKILKRFKFDNKNTDKILRLIKWHDRRVEPTYKAVRKAVRKIGDDIFLDWFKVQEADMKAQNPEYLSERQKKLKDTYRIYMEIKEANHCISIQQLDITGYDLIHMGIAQGKEIGRILNKLLDLVIENPELNKKEILIELVKKNKH